MTQGRMTILVLEDCPEREYRMRDALVDRFPQFDAVFARDAVEFAVALDRVPSGRLALVSLDHDLEPSDERPDPGDGRVAAAELAARPPEAPVVIHSTNGPAAEAMRSELLNAGYNVVRVLPAEGFGWVRRQWFRVVRSLIVRGVPPEGHSDPAEVETAALV